MQFIVTHENKKAKQRDNSCENTQTRFQGLFYSRSGEQETRVDPGDDALFPALSWSYWGPDFLVKYFAISQDKYFHHILSYSLFHFRGIYFLIVKRLTNCANTPYRPLDGQFKCYSW